MTKLDVTQIEKIWGNNDVHELLVKKYSDDIKLNFKPENLQFEEFESWDSFDDDESKIECAYVGSVFSIFPSGKFYMPWTTNQTIKDVWKDEAFSEALSNILESHNMWFQGGEGDPTDIFICRSVE
jgi:hypothetical protein